MELNLRADDMTRALCEWASTAVPELTWEVARLAAPLQEKGGGIRLLRVAPEPAPREVRNRTQQVWLDYLVTLRHDDPLLEQRYLAELVFSCTKAAAYRVDPDALPWLRDLGLPATAAFVLRAPLKRIEVLLPAALVRFPHRLEYADIAVFEGLVLGPDEVPIAGARIDADGLPSMATDARGRFRLVGGSVGSAPMNVRVRARDVEARTDIRPGVIAVVHLPVEK